MWVVPAIKGKRDKPIVSYTGDSVVLDCEMKQTPITWEWYKANGTEKVKYCTFTLTIYMHNKNSMLYNIISPTWMWIQF